MKRNILNIFVAFMITLLNVNFCFSIEKKETLKELSDEIQKINNDKYKQEKKIQTLKKELYLQFFFREDLLEIQKNELKKIIFEYKKTKDRLDEAFEKTNFKNKEKLIKDLLNNEKEIYKNLLPYIKISKYEEYKDFIRKDIELVNKKLELEIEKNYTQKKLDRKLVNIRKKIKKHKKIINKKVEEIINNRIEEKLEKFIKREKFLNLSVEQKKIFFQRLERKMKKKLNLLKENKIENEKKIRIYKIILDKINEYSKKLN